MAQLAQQSLRNPNQFCSACGEAHQKNKPSAALLINVVDLETEDIGEEACGGDRSPRSRLFELATGQEVEEDTSGLLEAFVAQAESLVSRYVTMVVEPESAGQLADMLQDSHVCKATGTVAIWYILAHAGESSALAHCRPLGLGCARCLQWCP